MSIHAGRPGSGAGGKPGQEERIAALHLELERVIWELARLEPSHLATVPVALPTALAQLMSEQARALDVPLSDIMVSYLCHGAVHTALEAGEPDSAAEFARIIRRLSAPDVWARFVQRHPEVRER